MTTIKDTIHDHVDLPDYATTLLDTTPMQRLRRISQLGATQLVYPGATHTRFAHSIGAAHLATRAAHHLNLNNTDTRHIVTAALLHDTPHPPYNHAIDRVLNAHNAGEHDDHAVIRDTLTDIEPELRAHDINPNRVARLITGADHEPLSDLVAGTIDVDRLDYLARDAAMTGVTYGDIEHERLLRALDTHNDRIVLNDGVHAAETVLVARAYMTTAVYAHHATRAANVILRRATHRLLETDTVTPADLRRMDEHDFRAVLRRDNPAAARRLDERDLPKRAAWLPADAVPTDALDAADSALADRRDLEAQIATRAGVDATRVWVDVPPRDPAEGFAEAAVPVTTGSDRGEVTRLDAVSALVDALNRAGEQWWRVGVFAPREDVEAVRCAARSVLGVDADVAMVQDRDAAQHAPSTATAAREVSPPGESNV